MMHPSRRFRFGAWLLLLLGICHLASGQPKAWDFRITATGLPYLQIPSPLVFPAEEFCLGLALRHDLVFDGQRYVSRFRIPELYSSLTPSQPGVYRWMAPDGISRELRVGRPFHSAGRNWVLSAAPDSSWQIKPSDGQDIYFYRHCVLTKWIHGERGYVFAYEGDRLASVAREGAGGRRVVQITVDKTGRQWDLELGGQVFRLQFDESHRLRSCRDVFATNPPIEFEYTDDLLTRADWGVGPVRYAWGAVRQADSYNLGQPDAPAVISDGTFDYKISRYLEIVTVHFREHQGRRAGVWSYNQVTRQMIDFSDH